MQGVKVNVEAQNLPSLVPGRLRKQFPGFELFLLLRKPPGAENMK